MATTHFSALTDLVLLEIFAYLSCEDALYAFADLYDFRLVDLLRERGAFRHICLSSQLSRLQYSVLSNGIWCYDSVRSLVCKQMFSDFIDLFTPCQMFHSLTELRLLYGRCPEDPVKQFVSAHSSTLTQFTMSVSNEAFVEEVCETFLHTVLPHLSRLKLLHTDWCSEVQVEYI